MSKLINFFFSFDKLMKEGLVRALFWLGLLLIGLIYGAEVLEAIRLEWFAAFIDFLRFFAELIFAIVAVRVVAELAIAIFRMNDNLSPDGGKSETADIDPVLEARQAAELAAKRAQTAAKSATGRSKTATNDLKDKVSTKAKPQVAPVKKIDSVKTASASADTVKTVDVKPASMKKAAPKKTAAKKTSSTSKPAAKKAATTKSTGKIKRAPGLKLDGTPRKKPGPRPKT